MPTNKIGALKAGQGLRRNIGQAEGEWRNEEAHENFRMGAETKPERSSPDRSSRTSRFSGANE
ncbi:MAG: hypothetical protein ACM3XM_14290 [Mycobacterium leprae]